MTGKTNDSTAPLELIVLTPHGEAVDVHCDSVHLTVCDDETGHGGGQVGFHRGHLPAVLALGDGRRTRCCTARPCFTPWCTAVLPPCGTM